eukprot:1644941-Amphidinium_carterae.1
MINVMYVKAALNTMSGVYLFTSGPSRQIGVPVGLSNQQCSGILVHDHLKHPTQSNKPNVHKKSSRFPAPLPHLRKATCIIK